MNWNWETHKGSQWGKAGNYSLNVRTEGEWSNGVERSYWYLYYDCELIDKGEYANCPGFNMSVEALAKMKVIIAMHKRQSSDYL